MTRSQDLAVYDPVAFRVVNGANLGDPVGLSDDLMPDDIYALSATAVPMPMALEFSPDGDMRIGRESRTGLPGAAVHVDCALTFMSEDGNTVEALMLAELGSDGTLAQAYMLPLGPMTAKIGHTLVGIDTDEPERHMARSACVFFCRGTHITLASGAQVPVEKLQPGDRVLTRDDGAQPLRWIGSTTIRATGALAPVHIAAGALNNLNDLVVSPEHRLFIYQRSDKIGLGRSEVLVKARHLVNGTTVTCADGGFVEYFQLLFDRHQIIYAEGIAAESMLLDARTKGALPREVAATMGKLLEGHIPADGDRIELDETQARQKRDIAELLRRASIG